MRMDEQSWNERYSSQEQLFSGNVNGVLATEIAELPPGRALDLGCGEGADALWLAARGWHVTAVDISRVALERAAASAEEHDQDTAARVAWHHGDLTTTTPPESSFDLVSAQYLPLAKQHEHAALRGLLAAVAPGGTLLVAAHDPADLPADDGHGVDPGAYYQAGEIAALLGEDWVVQIHETRPRTALAPLGTRHVDDVVLRARRLR
ncbi:class I SAM-dependent methyltransferase [Salinifilum ghardaiensis]